MSPASQALELDREDLRRQQDFTTRATNVRVCPHAIHAHRDPSTVMATLDKNQIEHVNPSEPNAS
jgi:hypothetical protein